MRHTCSRGRASLEFFSRGGVRRPLRLAAGEDAVPCRDLGDLGAPNRTRGAGAPNRTRDVGVPNRTRDVGAPNMTRGVGAPNRTRGLWCSKQDSGTLVLQTGLGKTTGDGWPPFGDAPASGDCLRRPGEKWRWTAPLALMTAYLTLLWDGAGVSRPPSVFYGSRRTASVAGSLG